MQSTSAILMENMDLYMLNPCSNKIWYARIHFLIFFLSFYFIFVERQSFNSFSSLRFIIELCEPVQVKQLDIANFELFSSTPKDFLVSISDRYKLCLSDMFILTQYGNICCLLLSEALHQI